MKTTKTNSTKKTNGKSSGSSAKKACGKKTSNKQSSSSDPDGSYTGNPLGWGKYAEPVQDVDDL
ncbi:MAG: hypothetical protein NC350_02035 [Corallococcus sp.]|nr:hypothetical protein [Corallococcus sp.]